MLRRSFVESPHNHSSPASRVYSTQEIPLVPDYYTYKQEIPINYSPMPHNISPPRVYEQYSMPINLPVDTSVIIKSPPPVITPLLTNQSPVKRSFIMNSTSIPPPMVTNVLPTALPIITTVYQPNPQYEKQTIVMKNAPPMTFPNFTSQTMTPRNRDRNDELVIGLKIENERLSFLLKEKEEELNSFKAKCIHLETHFEDRHESHNNHRIQELEDKLNLLLLENKKLNHIINDKNIEIESWRSRSSYNELAFQDAKVLSARIKDLELRNGSLLEELEKWKLNYYEIDRVRTHDEHLKRSVFKEKESFESEMKNSRNLIKIREGEIDDLKFKLKQYENNNRDGRNFEQRLVILSSDYENLQRLHQDKLSEIESLKQKNYNLETSLHEFRLKKDSCIEHENRIALLSTEITRLNSLLKNKNEEIESFRLKYSKLEYSTKEINVFENELRRTRELLELRNREVQEWKGKCIKYENSISELKTTNIRYKENEDRIALYMSDINRLNDTIRAKNQDIERLEYSLNNSKGYENEIFSLKGINEARLKEIEDLRLKCKRYEESLYDTRNRQQSTIEYENKIAMLATEVQRVNHLLRAKNEEVETLKIKGLRVEGGFDNYRELQTKIDIVGAENQRLNSIIENQNHELNQSRFNLQDSGVIRNKTFEQNELIAGLTREIEELRRRLFDREMEIQNLQRNGQQFGYSPNNF